MTVEKPARYVGGEVGSLAKYKEKSEKNIDFFRTLIAFPDLYEIGMGNQALRIIYNYMNDIPGVLCDRAFAPAPDFEKLLRENNFPLYGLDTGISLDCVDLLMFTLGYELGLNGILTMLDVSGIPVRCNDREDCETEYPIVIAGGPAVSNPLPYSPFIDAFWIGEVETSFHEANFPEAKKSFFDLVAQLAELKKRGQERAGLLEKIAAHPNVWTKGKGKAIRAIHMGFSQNQTDTAPSLVYPVPNMKIVQNHGTVEIMRGCPNGCRFCHAGFWYRPARQKTIEQIVKQVNQMVTLGGWQQISLSSLSSGDFFEIEKLIDVLNDRFSEKKVSFQLPSLRVSSFALSLLEKISKTRKSGLTFAVETPQHLCQMAINKEVTRESVVAILDEAKKRGWKSAKFYFMIGLLNNEQPASISEEEEIVTFILDVTRKTRMSFNINVGIFIPKPHTPYQYFPQLDSQIAFKKLSFIRSKLKPFGHKVSISDPLISQIEGMLSRGDERAGFLCEQAFRGGSRLEPWDEYINRDIWLEILEKNSEYVTSIFKGNNEQFPWLSIDSCVKNKYLLKEFEKSNKSLKTVSCKEKCNNCGVCFGKNKDNLPQTITNHHEPITRNISVNPTDNQVNGNSLGCKADPSVYRMLFSFCKEGCAAFLGHLSLIEVFSMSFRRADIPVIYTQGFNTIAKIEFASPLSTGISAFNEIASVDFKELYDAEKFVLSLNKNLPDGIRINKAEIFLIKSGQKKHSLSSLLWGFSYDVDGTTEDCISFASEKAYKQNRLNNGLLSLFSLKRNEVFARNITGTENEYLPYFEVYKYLYSRQNKHYEQ
ncbi:MAG: TIGR03936 family radical SAM-associated protein [Treponema sp.]|nr:TIGR03936 family radical SAM-associated protein [Treponema sp.]